MKARVLLACDRGWHVLAGGDPPTLLGLPATAGAEPAEAAAMSAAWCSSSLMPVLAIPSAWCYAAGIESPEDLRPGSAPWRRAAVFALEERIPLAAEEMAADFVTHPGGALGVAADARRLGPVLAALDAAGGGPGVVAPLSLLLAPALQERAPDADLLLVAEQDTVAATVLKERTVMAHHVLAGKAALMIDRLEWIHRATHQDGQPWRVVGVGIDPAMRDALAEASFIENAAVLDPPSAGAAGNLADLLAEAVQREVIVNLRRGPLRGAAARGPFARSVKLAFAAACLLLGCLSFAGLLLADRYERAAADLYQRQAQVAVAALDRPARQPVRELEGQLASLRDGDAAAGADAGAAARPQVLDLLRGVFAALPDAPSRFDLQTITVEGNRFQLEGEAAGIADLQQLVSALRASAFEVTDPDVRLTREGLRRFTIMGGLLTAADRRPR